tara:strand:- start:486 stop:1016 length:531 start_codon:yes stop_codon:yes gene_type:complete
MKITESKLDGVYIIEPKIFQDNRGLFLETFRVSDYKNKIGISETFVQDSISRSSQGVLRGMHFQKNNPQGKLVHTLKGEVFDVVVDMRKDSKTFGSWIGEYLSEENRKQFWIPPGLAHGFVVISEYADLYYKLTQYYDPVDEGCLIWNDGDVGIKWPINEPMLSPKDREGLLFKEL